MVYIIYLISNEKQYKLINDVYKSRDDEIITCIDLVIKKRLFKDMFEDISEELMNEIKNEMLIRFKTINKDIKKIYKEKRNNIGIIKLDLIDSLKKKNITEMDSIFELNPILSFILEEHLYNKNIIFEGKILNKCEEIDISKKLVIIGSYTLILGLKELIKSKKIHKEIYFKNDFQTPIEYIIYEHEEISKI